MITRYKYSGFKMVGAKSLTIKFKENISETYHIISIFQIVHGKKITVILKCLKFGLFHLVPENKSDIKYFDNKILYTRFHNKHQYNLLKSQNTFLILVPKKKTING